MIKKIQLPLSREDAGALRAGDMVLLSGTVLTARDAAHKLLCEAIGRGEALPVDLMGETIYYVGPAPAKPGAIVGPAGPTSSYRMDSYTEQLLKCGLRGMIGKGRRSEAALAAINRYGAVYFGAVGGAAALLMEHITACETVAYGFLASEAIFRMTFSDFPAMVLYDTLGNDAYETGPNAYRALIGAEA